MKIPKSYQEGSDEVKEVEKILELKQSLLYALNRQIQANKEFQNVLHGILQTPWHRQKSMWQRDDYFFQKNGFLVVVREYVEPFEDIALTPNDRCRLWAKYMAQETESLPIGAHKTRYAMLPPWFAIIPFADVDRSPCPLCGTAEPLIAFFPLRSNEAPLNILVCCGKVHKTSTTPVRRYMVPEKR